MIVKNYISIPRVERTHGIQFDGSFENALDIEKWVGKTLIIGHVSTDVQDNRRCIFLPHIKGKAHAYPGDYIIKNLAGDVYVLKSSTVKEKFIEVKTTGCKKHLPDELQYLNLQELSDLKTRLWIDFCKLKAGEVEKSLRSMAIKYFRYAFKN